MPFKSGLINVLPKTFLDFLMGPVERENKTTSAGERDLYGARDFLCICAPSLLHTSQPSRDALDSQGIKPFARFHQ